MQDGHDDDISKGDGRAKGTGAPLPPGADHGGEATGARDGGGRDDHGQNDRGRVVRLTDSGGRDIDRILAGLRATWDELRAGRAVPERSDIEPKALRSAINYAFILERIAPGAARFRVAGRHLIDLMGMEVRGMPLCALFNPDSRGHLSDVLETVFAGPQIAELVLRSDAAYARPELNARLLLLPLRSDLGDVTRVLGAVVSTGGIGCAPRRFDLLAEELTPVIAGARTLQPSPSGPGFAESPEPWRPPRPARKKPLLPSRRRTAASGAEGEGITAQIPADQLPAGKGPMDKTPAGKGAAGKGATDRTATGQVAPDTPAEAAGSTPEARRQSFRIIPGGL